MLVLVRAESRWEDRRFRDFPEFLGPGDCLVLNDSKVFPARLLGQRPGGGRVEILLLRPRVGEWDALVRPGRKLGVGERIRFDAELEAEVVARGQFGERTLRFSGPAAGRLERKLEQIGHVPLPPYIRRSSDAEDRSRYQTVFARESGSAAAPTAGLHFTEEILDRCREAGAETARVTLHVGLGTFQPLRAEQLASGRLHGEAYSVAPADLERVRNARRVVAVGTTSVRTLETVAASGELQGETSLLIQPGYAFRTVGAMLTNFHLPGASLLLLVCAFAGTELAMAAYRHAVEARYRFYSYGDCLLIV